MRTLSVLIYKIDSSKLVPIGQPGYQKGQEQARIYFDEVPKGDFTVAISDENLIAKIASGIGFDLRENHRILVQVDNQDAAHVGLTVYYYEVGRGTAQHCTVSYANCEVESSWRISYWNLLRKRFMRRMRRMAESSKRALTI